MDERLFYKILQLHHVFDNLEMDLLDWLGKDELDRYIKKNFWNYMIEHSRYLISVKRIYDIYACDHITYLLSMKYPLLQFDSISYVLELIRLCIIDKIYNNEFYFEEPIVGWLQELYTDEIILYLNPYKFKHYYYMRMLESCLMYLTQYNNWSYDILLNSPIYYLVGLQQIEMISS